MFMYEILHRRNAVFPILDYWKNYKFAFLFLEIKLIVVWYEDRTKLIYALLIGFYNYLVARFQKANVPYRWPILYFNYKPLNVIFELSHGMGWRIVTWPNKVCLIMLNVESLF